MVVRRLLSYAHGRSSSILLVGAMSVAYVVAYLPLYHAIENSAGIFSTLPVLAAAWCFGPRVGVVVGLMTLPVNALLTTQFAGQELEAWARNGGVVGGFSEVLVGFVVGYASRSQRQSLSLLAQQVETERALRVSEELFSGVFNDAPIGIVVTEPNLRIFRANHTFCTMSGYSEEEAIGKSLSELIDPNGVNPDLATLWERLCERSGPLRTEKRCLRRDGSVFPAVVTAAAVRDAAGDACYGIQAVEDVTRQRQLEELARQGERLESLRHFAAGVAHNFNNALAIVSGHAELAVMELEPGHPAREGLTHIRRVADSSESIIRELLVFSRQEVSQPSLCELNTLVRSTANLLLPLFGDHIQVDTDLDPRVGTIWADPGEVEQIITNLAFNARDAMAAGGVLHVKTGHREFDDATAAIHPAARAGCYTTLTVSDTGTGIDSETRRRLCEPFFTTKEQGKGVGLGLAMVDGAVRQNGGFLSIVSQPAVGSTFVVHWPAVDSTVAAARDAQITSISGASFSGELADTVDQRVA